MESPLTVSVRSTARKVSVSGLTETMTFRAVSVEIANGTCIARIVSKSAATVFSTAREMSALIAVVACTVRLVSTPILKDVPN